MSCVYWHSPSRTAELRGSERAWLGHVARGPATAAWNLDAPSAYEQAMAIMRFVRRPHNRFGADYLHDYAAKAVDERNANTVFTPGRGTVYERQREFVSALKLALRADAVEFEVAGIRLSSDNLDLNTALVAGSDPVRLAAKIDGSCESHAWVDGPDRAWLADIIDAGLAAGLYRHGIWFVGHPCDGPAADQPDRQWSDQGWADVLTLLRERNDEPVVMSYSVCDGFPNAEIADWTPEPLPDEWVPDWADTPEGLTEWQEYDEADRASNRHDAEQEQWYGLADDEKWRLAMAGLRDRGWGRLAPDTLAAETFSWPVTVYDLLAPDRDERIRAACIEPDEMAEQ